MGDLSHRISPILLGNFADFPTQFRPYWPEISLAFPKKLPLVDNFSTTLTPKFRKEAAVAELISPYFWLISLFLNELYSFNEVEK